MMTGALLVVVGLVCTAILLATSVSPVVGWVWLITAWTVIGAATSAISTPDGPSAARLLHRVEQARGVHRAVLAVACVFSRHLPACRLGGGAQVSQLTAAIILAALATLSAMAATRLWPATYPRPIMAGVKGEHEWAVARKAPIPPLRSRRRGLVSTTAHHRMPRGSTRPPGHSGCSPIPLGSTSCGNSVTAKRRLRARRSLRCIAHRGQPAPRQAALHGPRRDPQRRPPDRLPPSRRTPRTPRPGRAQPCRPLRHRRTTARLTGRALSREQHRQRQFDLGPEERTRMGEGVRAVLAEGLQADGADQDRPQGGRRRQHADRGCRCRTRRGWRPCHR